MARAGYRPDSLDEPGVAVVDPLAMPARPRPTPGVSADATDYWGSVMSNVVLFSPKNPVTVPTA